jgi:ribosome biogenesis protein Nip4
MKQIIAEINLHEQHLKIAESINLQNPILKSMGVSQAVVNEPLELFYKGTIVLSKKISYLTNLLNKTKDLTLDYDPVLEQASVAELISISPTTFAFIAFFLGLFLSSIIILIRNIKK